MRVKVQGGTPPTLTFVGARERTVLVADGVEVDARGVATSCDGRPMSGRAVSYAWDVVDAVTGARLPLASSSRDARKFAAGAGALAPGAYDLVATVVDDAYGFATNGSVRLRVERSVTLGRSRSKETCSDGARLARLLLGLQRRRWLLTFRAPSRRYRGPSASLPCLQD